MHRLTSACFLLALTSQIPKLAAETLVPAGSLIQCIVSEPKLSSKTANIGDPVLCKVSHAELYGRSTFPYGSYLQGRFEDYKNPGHFVGKGWLELKFDRLIVRNEIVPISARVVDVPGFKVDKQGRIDGKGHATRDIVEWAIPILWPIDLLTLPLRGPRPTLKSETRLTLKVMDDLGLPDAAAPIQRETAQIERRPIQPQPPAQVIYVTPYQAPSYANQTTPAPIYVNPAPVYVQPAPVRYRYLPPPPPPPPYAYGYPYGPVGQAAYRYPAVY